MRRIESNRVGEVVEVRVSVSARDMGDGVVVVSVLADAVNEEEERLR